MSKPFDPNNKTCKEKGCVRLIGNHCHARDNGKFLLFGGREYPDCEFFELPKKPTIFDRITASPEVLAEKLVIPNDSGRGYFAIIIDEGVDGYGWYKTYEEAITATVEKLKEVEK